MNNWTEWKGDECPVEVGTLVDVRYRDGKENMHVEAGVPTSRSGSMKMRHATRWDWLGWRSDIVAYRLHQPEQSTQIKQLIAKRNKQAEKVKRQTAKLDRINEEIKQAIAQLESEVERDTGLTCKITEPAGDGIPEDVDVYDPATWMKGDVVECVQAGGMGATEGKRYIYYGVIDDEGDPVLEKDDQGDNFGPEDAKYKFISRPQ